MSRILVLGGGFAGLWAAASAARLLDEAGNRGTTVTLVNRDRWHTVRVRNYEPDLRDIRVPLDDVLGPIGVERIEAEINDILPDQNAVACADGRRIGYDRLVIALGSELVRPPVPGLVEQGFDAIPTYVTVMDLGAWGALYTQGWDRRLVASGAEAKRTKETINRVRIYPPLTRDRQAILDAAAPFVQAPPAR